VTRLARPPSAVARDRRAPPVYQRVLSELLGSGTSTVSSEHLAAAAGVGAAVVRKDLSLFGSFGPGDGYDVSLLIVSSTGGSVATATGRSSSSASATSAQRS